MDGWHFPTQKQPQSWNPTGIHHNKGPISFCWLRIFDRHSGDKKKPTTIFLFFLFRQNKDGLNLWINLEGWFPLTSREWTNIPPSINKSIFFTLGNNITEKQHIHADRQFKVATTLNCSSVHCGRKPQCTGRQRGRLVPERQQVLMTQALVSVNIFDPEILPCGELAQLCCKETELPEVPKSFRPREKSELIYSAVHRHVD